MTTYIISQFIVILMIHSITLSVLYEFINLKLFMEHMLILILVIHIGLAVVADDEH